MQPNTAQPSRADQPLKVPIVIARRQGRAEARCKDQARVLPELNARCEPIGLLAHAATSRLRPLHPGAERSAAILLSLAARGGSLRPGDTAASVAQLERADQDQHHAKQAPTLPLTQAQRDCDQPSCLEPITRRSQKQPRLLCVEQVNLDGCQRRWVDGGYRVPRNQLPPHCDTQRSAEKRVEPSHALRTPHSLRYRSSHWPKAGARSMGSLPPLVLMLQLVTCPPFVAVKLRPVDNPRAVSSTSAVNHTSQSVSDRPGGHRCGSPSW